MALVDLTVLSHLSHLPGKLDTLPCSEHTWAFCSLPFVLLLSVAWKSTYSSPQVDVGPFVNLICSYCVPCEELIMVVVLEKDTQDILFFL